MLMSAELEVSTLTSLMAIVPGCQRSAKPRALTWAAVAGVAGPLADALTAAWAGSVLLIETLL